VPGFEPPVSFEALHDWEAMTANIAAQDHWFGGEDQVIYHPITYGYLLGEIIRRVDGRGPARFFREEVAGPAGIDFQMGLTSRDDLARLATQGYLHPPGQSPLEPDPLYARVEQSVAAEGDWTSWARLSAECPASVGLTNARGLARVCAIFANGGQLDGVRYLAKTLVDEASREQGVAHDPTYGEVHLGLGLGLDGADFPGPTPTAFHWGGYGGSEGLMDQATGLSFGYVMNNLIEWPAGQGDPRLGRFYAALREVSAGL